MVFPVATILGQTAEHSLLGCAYISCLITWASGHRCPIKVAQKNGERLKASPSHHVRPHPALFSPSLVFSRVAAALVDFISAFTLTPLIGNEARASSHQRRRCAPTLDVSPSARRGSTPPVFFFFFLFFVFLSLYGSIVASRGEEVDCFDSDASRR